MALPNTKRSARVFQCSGTGGSSPHLKWPVKGEGGGEKEREEGGTKHTELSHGNQTHNKVCAGRPAASRAPRALLVRQ